MCQKIAVKPHNIIFDENPFSSSYCRHTKQQAAYFAEHVKMKQQTINSHSLADNDIILQ